MFPMGSGSGVSLMASPTLFEYLLAFLRETNELRRSGSPSCPKVPAARRRKPGSVVRVVRWSVAPPPHAPSGNHPEGWPTGAPSAPREWIGARHADAWCGVGRLGTVDGCADVQRREETGP